MYAITGHTSGIGKIIFEKLSPNIIGFSRSNGYDINHDREKIIDQLDHVDIFINNAKSYFSQSYLFIELYDRWRLEDKTIINVGSNIADSGLLYSKYYSDKLIQYQIEKSLLRDLSLKAQKSKGKCKVKYVSFGQVGIEISAEEAADQILR